MAPSPAFANQASTTSTRGRPGGHSVTMPMSSQPPRRGRAGGRLPLLPVAPHRHEPYRPAQPCLGHETLHAVGHIPTHVADEHELRVTVAMSHLGPRLHEKRLRLARLDRAHAEDDAAVS